MQGVEFEAKLRLLPLVAYDMVLGMDWLNTPLWNTKVNWKEKYIHVFREGSFGRNQRGSKLSGRRAAWLDSVSSFYCF